MNIVQLTPGTGSFFCGGCVRDHALVKGLKKLGHDVAMVPLYLPLVLDEARAEETPEPVFFGGINVYLQQKSAVFRHTPRWMDAMFDTTPLLHMAGQRAGMTQARDLGELTLSMLQGEEGKQKKELDRLIDHLAAGPHPDIVCLSNGLLVGLAREIRRRLNSTVICTLQGEDTFLDALAPPYNEKCWDVMSERARELDGLIAVSRYYGELMTGRMHTPPSMMHVVHNGVPLDDVVSASSASATTHPDPPVIGYLARMCHGKGLHTLVDAFIALRQRGLKARLHIGGVMIGPDEAWTAPLRDKLREAGLDNDTSWFPNMTRAEKVAFLRGLTVLSVPAMYGEAFGLYLLEAMAFGVPVVQPRHAAFPEIIEHTGGGILVEPTGADALTQGLEKVLRDDQLRLHLAMTGRQAVAERFTNEAMAQRVAEVYQRCISGRLTGVQR